MGVAAYQRRPTHQNPARPRRRSRPSVHRGLLPLRRPALRTALRTVRRGAGRRRLWRVPEQTLGALAPLPEQRVASCALSLREVGLEHRVLLVPPHPLGTRHLTNHESARGDLRTDVLQLRPPVLSCSVLHSPHLQSVVAEPGIPLPGAFVGPIRSSRARIHCFESGPSAGASGIPPREGRDSESDVSR
jgi:hypothetical protein